MERLSNDCLLSIFSHLPFFERVKCELVCKKWRSLMSYTDFWSFDLATDIPCPVKTEKLSLEVRSVGGPEMVRGVQEVMDQSVLHKLLQLVLRRCGRFLNEFGRMQYEWIYASQPLSRLNIKNLYFQPATFRLLTSLCPNLELLSLSAAIFHEDCMQLLVEAWPKLEDVQLHCLMFVREERGVLVEKIDGEVKEGFSRFLASHPGILSLYLSGTMFRPKFQNPALEMLDVDHMPINDETVEELTVSSPNLVRLHMGLCPGVQDCHPLSNLVHLEDLFLLCQSHFRNEDLALICKKCPKLSSLDISGCQLVTDVEPLGLVKNLRRLSVTHCLNDEILLKIAMHGELVWLTTTWCKQLTSTGIGDLGNLCPKLEWLSLYDTPVGDEGVLTVLKNCQKLRKLSLIKDTKISNRVLGGVGSMATKLTTLDIKDCPNINQEGFQQLLDSRKQRMGKEMLPELKISGVSDLSNDLVKGLRKFCKVVVDIERPSSRGSTSRLFPHCTML